MTEANPRRMPRSLFYLVLGLAACVSCARSTPPNDDLVAGALPEAATPRAAFAANAAADTGAVVDGWVEGFHDPLLNQLVDEAMAHNRDLAASVARVEAAGAQARQAGADLKPQVSAAVGATTAGAGGQARTDQMGAGLSLSWELDVWGRLGSAERAAAEQYASQQADYEFARQSLAAQVAKAYFLAIQAVNQEMIATSFSELQAKNADLVALRQSVGRASEFEAALARSAAATAKDQQQQAVSGRERSARSLEMLVGRYPSAEFASGSKLPVLPGPVPVGLPSQLLERRPDLIAATRRVASAFNQVESAKAARLPRISITAEVGGASQNLRNLSLDDVFWNLAGNLMGPIFDGGRLKEQVVIENARQQEALAMYGAAALRAFQQVEQGLSEEQRLGNRLALVEAASRDQAQASRLAGLRFDAGTIDQIDLIKVQGDALNAQLAELAVKVERLTNRVDLHLALGGSFTAPPSAPEDDLPASTIVEPNHP